MIMEAEAALGSLVIFIIVIVAAFSAWRGGLFGGKQTKVDVNVTTPQR